ncbi:MAG: hypothetical protein ACPG77_05035 [Nannocystaceae bacterium]
MLKSIGPISQVVVVGDRRKFLAALVTIDELKLEQLAKDAGSTARDLAAAADCSKIQAFLMAEVEKVNKQLARVQTIKKIKILPVELTIEGGELTPTMKVKRKIVNKKYASEVEALYA